jgi:hypothetical protein
MAGRPPAAPVTTAAVKPEKPVRDGVLQQARACWALHEPVVGLLFAVR